MASASERASRLAEMKARSGIRFYVRDRDIEVDIVAVDAIRGELEKIAATNPPRGDIEGLVEALKLHVGDLDLSGPAFKPDEQQHALLLRATDHLRNLEHKGDVLKLHDALCYPGQWISYRIRAGVEAFDFDSYSGSYGMNDRLVDARHSEYLIVGLGPGDPPEFVVDAWRPAE
jgi:hypothetical protein